jgi:Tol biopolymer transport system component
MEGWIDVRIDRSQFEVQPGKIVEIPVVLTNRGSEVDHLEFSLEGILPEWLGRQTPILMLAPGKTQQISLEVQPPSQLNAPAGVYPLLLRISSLRHSERFLVVDLQLIVAAAYRLGPISAFLAQNEFQVQPGAQVQFPLVILNDGFRPDQYSISVKGNSVIEKGMIERWFGMHPASINLQADQEEIVTVTCAPPRNAENRAGTYAFTLVITGQNNPTQSIELQGKMTLAPFYACQLNLLTPTLKPGERGVFEVVNLGNSHDFFIVQFNHPKAALEYRVISLLSKPGEVQRDPMENPYLSPWNHGTALRNVRIQGDEIGTYPGLMLHIPAGEKLRVEFLPTARKPSAWQNREESFTVEVTSSRLEKKLQECRAMLSPAPYPWLIQVFGGVFLILFILFFLMMFLWIRSAGIKLFPERGTATNTIPVVVWTSIPAKTQTLTTPVGTVTLTPVPSTPTQTVTVLPGTVVTPAPSATSTPTLAAPTATPTISTPAVTSDVLPIQNTGRLAMESDLEEELRIFVYDTNNLTFSPLPTITTGGSYPAWSPDGKQLAFTTNREGNNEIYVLNLENGVHFNLTNHPANDTDPSWSPDGQKIVFTSDRDNNLEVYVIELSTQSASNLTNNPANDSQPDWFLDQRIAFTSDRDGNQEVYIMNPDGQSQTNLSRNTANDFSPAGARDLSLIAFVSDRDNNPEIYVMSLQGENPVNLTNNQSGDEAPVWSPDSQWIAFMTNRMENWEIFVMRRDGSQLFNVTSLPPNERNPAWVGNP